MSMRGEEEDGEKEDGEERQREWKRNFITVLHVCVFSTVCKSC